MMEHGPVEHGTMPHEAPGPPKGDTTP